MNNKFSSPFSIATICLIILAVITFYKSAPTNSQITKVNQELYNFSSPSIIDNEKIITPSSMIGKKYMIHYFSSWCNACMVEYLELIKMQKDYDLEILGIIVKDDINKMLLILKKYGNPFTEIISDPSGEITSNVGLRALPETHIIDEQGVIIAKILGPLSKELIEKHLLPILN